MKKKKLISAVMALVLGSVSAYAFAMPPIYDCKLDCTDFCAFMGSCG